jgi:hypothetical protein
MRREGAAEAARIEQKKHIEENILKGNHHHSLH